MTKQLKGYSPMRVLRMLKHHGVPVPVGARTVSPMADTSGDSGGRPAASPSASPAACALLLLAFMNGSSMVPDDFSAVGKTADELRSYVRPDGGVYLGAFEVVDDPGGVVVVFGDPAMSRAEAQDIALHYRAQLVSRYEESRATAASVPEPVAVYREHEDQPSVDNAVAVQPRHTKRQKLRSINT